MIDLNKIGKDGVEFIKKEFGITEDDLEKFDKDAWHELRLKCFDIECEEIDEDGECSDRGESAADIVSMYYPDIKAERIINKGKDVKEVRDTIEDKDAISYPGNADDSTIY